jgi:hypothetical protein
MSNHLRFPIPSGRRLRVAALASLVLLTLTGGAFTTWSIRAHSQEQKEARPVTLPLLDASAEDIQHPHAETNAGQQEQQREKHRPTPGASLETNEKLSRVSITILPEGFEPGELTMPAGKVLLAINKRIGAHSLDLELRLEGKQEVIRIVNMPEKVLSYSEIFNLHPGNYTLTATDNPEWVCRITVVPLGRSS